CQLLMIFCVLNNRNSLHSRINCLTHRFRTSFASIWMSMNAAACCQHYIGSHIFDNLLHCKLGRSSRACIHHRFDVPPWLGKELEATIELFVSNREFSIRMSIDLEVSAGPMGNLTNTRSS